MIGFKERWWHSSGLKGYLSAFKLLALQYLQLLVWNASKIAGAQVEYRYSLIENDICSEISIIRW